MTVLFKAWAFVIHRNMEVAFESFNHILIFKVKKSVIPEVVSSVFCVYVCIHMHVYVCVHTDAHIHLSVFI